MIKMMSIALFLAACGCSSVNGDTTQLQNERLKRLEDSVVRLYYFQAHSECFTRYNFCRINKSEKECWAPHEQCVINVDKQYVGKI